MADKEVKIGFRTTADTKGAKEVKKEIDKTTAAIDRQGKEADQSMDQAERAVEELERAIIELEKEIDKAGGTTKEGKKQYDILAAGMRNSAVTARDLIAHKKELGKSSRNTGFAVLEFSRAIEDAQYGIRGVLNNIPGLIGHLGGGAGLAGAISLAAVGLTQLVEHLARFEGAAGEAAETLEVTRNQLDEFYKEAARDGTASFQAQIMRVVEALGQQNDALQTNLRLTREKRKAELKVASAGQDLELAQIAADQASGTISDDEAAARVRAVEIARIRAAAEEEIIKAQEDEQLVFDRKRDAFERQIETTERLSKAEEERAKLIEERNILQSRQEISDSMLAKGQEMVDQNSGFGYNVLGIGMEERTKGQEILRGARDQFSESDRQRLIQLESTILPQVQEVVEALRGNAQKIEVERENLLVAQSEAVRTRQLVESTETQVADLKEQTIETKAAAGRMTEANGALSTDIATLEKAASDSAAMTQADRKLVEVGLGQMRKIMADGEITARELAETNQVLGRLTTSVVGATKENTNTIQSLQISVGELERAIAVTKAENIRLSQQIKQVRGRQ